MSTKNASPLTGALILGGFVLLGCVVLFSVYGRLSAAPHEVEPSTRTWRNENASRPIQDPNPPAGIALTGFGSSPRPGAKVRTLADYYSLRAYPGAPPMIPHEVKNDGLIADDCLSCHRDGGYVPEQNAYAPITPHPDFLNCRQCHVPKSEEGLFAETGWAKPEPPKRGRQAIPGGPLQLPHSLHMRTNCKACHVGPQAPVEIRTSHPERENCLQCHVPQEDVPVYRSKFDPRPELAHVEK